MLGKLSRVEKSFLVVAGGLAFFVYTVIAFLPWIAINNHWIHDKDGKIVEQVESTFGPLGTYGDMFGAANSLFTGLALAGLVYNAMLQRKQVEMQQVEIAILLAKETASKALLSVPKNPWIIRTITDRDETKKIALISTIYGRVENLSGVASDCRAYLVNIEWEEDGIFVQEATFLDPIRLQWFVEEEERSNIRGIDIPRQFTSHFKLMISKRYQNDETKTFRYMQFALGPKARTGMKTTLRGGARFRFTIRITADNSDSLSFQGIIFIGDKIEDDKVIEISDQGCEITAA